MTTRHDFDSAFETYHAENADKYAHLVKWRSVTDEQIKDAERAASIGLPGDFKEFVLAYGYGEIYFATIFCPLASKPDHVLYTMWDYFNWEQFGGDYVPVSSNGDELWTGFRVQDGQCSSRLVNFDVDEREYTGDGYDCIWDFVLQVGLVKFQ